MLPLNASLFLSAILFAIGTAGVIIRRNAIILFMCVELMLDAASRVRPASRRRIEQVGRVFFVIAVAAAEAAVGLAIIISVFRHAESVDIRNFSLLRW